MIKRDYKCDNCKAEGVTSPQIICDCCQIRWQHGKHREVGMRNNAERIRKCTRGEEVTACLIHVCIDCLNEIRDRITPAAHNAIIDIRGCNCNHKTFQGSLDKEAR